ncbi:MAG: oligosaccharide flippase family protein [Deltaproteobacteria bacterium]|nr:oligosaccharide flippase family protein [Deltaproteobacteria bacterium]
MSILSTIQKILPKGKFARNATILSGGTLLGQGLAVVIMPLLTRLYDPTDFGVLAIFVSILSVLAVIASLKYHLAIILPAENNMAINIAALSMLMVIGITVLTSLCLFFWGGKSLQVINMLEMKPYLWIIPLSLFGVGVYEVLHYWAIRRQNFRSIAQTKISQGIGLAVTQIAFGLITRGPIGLLLGHTIGWTSGSGTLASLFWKNDRQLIKEISLDRMKTMAIRYKKFPLISSISGAINSAGLQVAPMMLASMYGATIVGFFSLTQRIMGVPLRFVGTSVAQVYTSETARLAIDNPGGLSKHFIKRAKILLIIGGIPILILGQICPFVFGFIFGETWSEAGQYAQVLSVISAVNFVVLPLSSTLNVLEKQGTQFIWDIGRFTIVVFVFLICAKLKLPAFTTIGIYAASMSFAYVILFMLAYRAVKQMSNNKYA